MEFEWVPSTEVLCNPEILYVSKASDFLSYIFNVSEEYKDYTFDYDDMAG